MAKQRWKAVKLKQKFDRQRFKNFTGRYSEDNMFISKVQKESKHEDIENKMTNGRVGAKRRFMLQRRELILVSLPPSSRYL